jgi:hypothetical protein
VLRGWKLDKVEGSMIWGKGGGDDFYLGAALGRATARPEVVEVPVVSEPVVARLQEYAAALKDEQMGREKDTLWYTARAEADRVFLHLIVESGLVSAEMMEIALRASWGQVYASLCQQAGLPAAATQKDIAAQLAKRIEALTDRGSGAG